MWSALATARTAIFILLSSWHALGRHRLRAGLTMLGISIGIAAVMTMVSLGQGAHQLVIQRLENMGSNMIEIESGNRTIQGVSTAGDGLIYDDVVAIRQHCEPIAWASPHVDFRAQTASPGQNWATKVRGVDPDFQTITHWRVDEGQFISEAMTASAAKVVVLGRTVARQLFGGGARVLGETVRINGTPFKVVGVLVSKGANVQGDDQDDAVFIPWTTAQRRMLGIRHIKDIFLSAASREGIPDAKASVASLLRQRHHLTQDQPDDFNVRDFTDIANRVNETNHLMTVLLASVAAIALLIGGINTMSIMLVTVTERTREIGVRMAMGARVYQVRLQFVLEATLLTLVGGAAGVLIGIAASLVTARALDWPAVISGPTAALGLVVATSVGLVFGYYPARRASSLDPIEALRYE
jgi:putative ABC transport system permease protein